MARAWLAAACWESPARVMCCASWLDSVSRAEAPPSPGLLTSGFFSVPAVTTQLCHYRQCQHAKPGQLAIYPTTAYTRAHPHAEPSSTVTCPSLASSPLAPAARWRCRRLTVGELGGGHIAAAVGLRSDGGRLGGGRRVARAGGGRQALLQRLLLRFHALQRCLRLLQPQTSPQLACLPSGCVVGSCFLSSAAAQGQSHARRSQISSSDQAERHRLQSVRGVLLFGRPLSRAWA